METETKAEMPPPGTTVAVATDYDDIHELGDRIAELTMKQTVELLEYLKSKKQA